MTDIELQALAAVVSDEAAANQVIAAEAHVYGQLQREPIYQSDARDALIAELRSRGVLPPPKDKPAQARAESDLPW